MKGTYHEASFAEKRNALKMPGVRVSIHPTVLEPSEAMQIDTEQEWFLVSEASRLTGIAPSTLRHHIKRGHIATEIRTNLLDELARYLQENGSQVNLEQYQKEWFSIETSPQK